MCSDIARLRVCVLHVAGHGFFMSRVCVSVHSHVVAQRCATMHPKHLLHMSLPFVGASMQTHTHTHTHTHIHMCTQTHVMWDLPS
jgi:hypothetical protein